MTIISNVYVPEGIAMAADSRLTGYKNNQNGSTDRFTISDNAQKLVVVRNSTIGISFCGDAIIDNKTISDFLRVFDIEEVKETDTVQEVAQKLNDYLTTKYPKYHVIFMVAGYDNDEPFVYRIIRNGIERTNYSDNHLIFGASWDGEREAVSKLISDMSMNFSLMPLKDAVDFAEFLVDLTIQHSRFADNISTCGGPIDILVITKDFTEFYSHKIFKPQ